MAVPWHDGAMTESIEHPLSTTHKLPLRPLVREQMLYLLQQVPADLRGLLQVRFLDNGLTPVGLRLQPDPAVHCMMGLLRSVGEAVRDVTHGNHLSRLYEGEDFRAILENTSTANKTSLVTREHVTRDGRKIERYYADDNRDYADSFTLTDALKLSGLPGTDRLLLARVAGAIPADLHGCFTCDMVKQGDGRLRLHCVSVAPNLAAERLGETVLKPVADKIFEAHPNASRDHTAGVLGIKHHWRTMTLERHHLEALPASGRQIA